MSSEQMSDRLRDPAGSPAATEGAPDAAAPAEVSLPEELRAEFEVVRQLGRGGTAVVYLVRERALDREIALKVVHAGYATDEDSAARIEREARTLARLRHPKIVAIFGTRRLGDGRVALLMQHVPGRTLRAELERSGTLPLPRFERILRDILEALAHAHRRRIVHRDVKPENIYLDAESGFALLSDFGIARPWDAEFGITVTGAALGTPAYMAPEQVDGGQVDGRADLYSLGMLAYEMLAGRHPWAGESLYSLLYKQKQEEPPPITERRTDVPGHIVEVVNRLLRKDPEQRFENADAVLGVLDTAPRIALVPPAAPLATANDGPLLVPEARGPRHGEPPGDDADVDAAVAALRAGDASVLRLATVGASTDEPPHRTVPDRRDEPLAIAAEESDFGSGWNRRRYAFTIVAAMAAAVVVANGAVRLAMNGLAADEMDAGPASPAAVAASGPEPSEATPPAALPPPEPPGPVPAAISPVGGLDQQGPAGEPLPEALAVLVTDADGQPVAGVPVDFRIVIGSGRTVPESTRTDDAGRATALWLPDASGDSTVAVASISGSPDILARFTARLVAGRAARADVDGAGQQGAAGSRLPGPLVMRVVDAAGRAVPGTTVRFEVEGGGRVEPQQAVTDETGRVRAEWRLGPTAGEQRVRAHVAELAEPVTIFARATSPPLPTRSGLALGGTHTCYLDANGSAFCWGGNSEGQLGAGGDSGGPAAVRVQARSPLALLAAGVSHTCALDRDGRIHCWGANDAGQLGDGTRAHRRAPQPSEVDGRFVALQAGVGHTCALDSDGRLYCWGENRRGQLGSGDGADRSTPARVAGGRVFHAFATGWSHTCALDATRAAVCWGANDSGQLGAGTSGGDRAAPTAVAGNNRFAAIVAGNAHTCGLAPDGTAYCWGANANGQLGDGTATARAAPSRVAAPGPLASLVAGAAHTCALTRDGAAYCWGRNNFGQLGTGSNEDALRPAPVAGGLRFRSLSASGAHTCGTTVDGERYCWGYNLEGQLGDGSRVHRNRPTAVRVR